jgi:ribosome-associated protein
MEETEFQQEGRGRTARKREAKAIEQLAQRLVELPETALARLATEAALAKEIELARNTKGHSSRKRQTKHLAGYLRRNEEQCAAIREALDGQSISQRQETMSFHHLEEMRDRLCDAASFETAIVEIRSSYPHIDDRKLARLAHAVHETGDKKAAREIFRRLRKAQEADED